MKQTVLSAAVTFGIAALALAGTAQAQCWWTGLGYSCAAPPAYYPPYWAPYGYVNYPDYNGGFPVYSYKPAWLPSYPGPRPSSGAGR